MPILPPEYISTWYYFIDGAGFVRIFENWSETQEQEIEKVSFLQGDIGTHVMNVGGIKWVTNIESPALIVEFIDYADNDTEADNNPEGVTDSFDLLVYAFNFLRDPSAAKKASKEGKYIPDYLMRSGRVSVGQEGVKVSMEIVSSVPGAFAAKTFLPSSFATMPEGWPSVNYVYPNFIARVARFYDVTFYTSDSNQKYSYQVLSADIRINANISENYFINTGSQAPFFGIQGYHISGELELAVPPEFFPDVFIPQQNSIGSDGLQALNVNNADISLSLTGNANGLLLGSTQLRSKVARSLSPNQISKATVSFESYTNYSTFIVGQ